MIFETKNFKFMYQLEPGNIKIALRPSSIPAKVSNFRNLCVSGTGELRGVRRTSQFKRAPLAKKALRLVKPQNDFVKLPIGRKVQFNNKKRQRYILGGVSLPCRVYNCGFLFRIRRVVATINILRKHSLCHLLILLYRNFEKSQH